MDAGIKDGKGTAIYNFGFIGLLAELEDVVDVEKDRVNSSALFKVVEHSTLNIALFVELWAGKFDSNLFNDRLFGRFRWFWAVVTDSFPWFSYDITDSVACLIYYKSVSMRV